MTSSLAEFVHDIPPTRGPSPPPIPSRNPRRVQPTGVTEQDTHVPRIGDSSTLCMLLATYGPQQEIDRGSDQQKPIPRELSSHQGHRLSVLEDGDISEAMTDDTRKESRQSRRTTSSPAQEEKASQASSASGRTRGFRRYSAYLGELHCSLSTDSKSTKEREIEGGIMILRSNAGQEESLATIYSYDGIPETQVTAEGEDNRIEAWLSRGTFVTPPHHSEQASASGDTQSAVFEKTHPALQPSPIVTSSLPNDSRRDLDSPFSPLLPLSPLNNGRDVYGNLIPTNTQDYLTARFPPTSPTLQPVMQRPPELAPSSMPNLRGGGWWNNIGISQTEQEPSVKKKPSTIKSSSSQHSTPLLWYKHRSIVDDSESLPRTRRVCGGTSLATVSKKGKATTVAPDEWSDESDQYGFDLIQDRESKHEPHTLVTLDGTVVQGAFSVSTGPCTPTPETSLLSKKTPVPSPAKALDRGRSGSDARWAGMKPPRSLLSDTEDPPESPMTDLNYATRSDKRWNKAPSTGPPSRQPPLPPPKDYESTTGPASLVNPAYRYRFEDYSHQDTQIRRLPWVASPIERPTSPDDFHNDEAWELRSLQLGESVSLVGGRRPVRRLPVARDPVLMNHEQYQAQQFEAQREFRELCHDVMQRYNLEISKLERDLRYNEMTREQFARLTAFNVKNKNDALQHCSEETGYKVSCNYVLKLYRGRAAQSFHESGADELADSHR